MANISLGKFVVNGSTYSYNKLPPIDAIRFGTQCVKILGPVLSGRLLQVGGNPSELLDALGPALANLDSEALEGLLKTAYSYVYTPHNENLGDPAIFNTWFVNHPEDLYHVGLLAIYNLAKDFFPKLGDMLTPSNSPK